MALQKALIGEILDYEIIYDEPIDWNVFIAFQHEQ